MKSLLINIDDLGIAKEINDATRECYKKNAINSASIIACGDEFDDACNMLKSLQIKDIGVHLTFTGKFTPICHKSKFPDNYIKLFLYLFLGKINKEDIYKEFCRQIETVTQKGFNVTHLDSHEHIHILPGLFSLTMILAREFDIPLVRVPVEPIRIIKKNFRIKDLIRHFALKICCIGKKTKLDSEDIKYNTAFWGHFHSGRLNEDIFNYISENLSDGTNEIGMHISTKSDDLVKKYPWYKNAYEEYKIFISKDK